MAEQSAMIPVAKPWLGEMEVEATRRAILSCWVTQGPEVAAFERAFADYVGAPYACAVSNCTVALHLALRAVGAGPGDEVITVSHSFIATANSVRYCEAVPVFVDIAPDTFNVDIALLIAWMGFRQSAIRYDKQARRHGRSGWNLEKKLKRALDSVMSFTYLPIRLMSYLGLFVALLGFLYAGLVILHPFGGRPPEGWSSLMVVVLVIGGLQMLMMGVLGEYLWRTLDESRRRPQYVIETTTDSQAGTPQGRAHI